LTLPPVAQRSDVEILNALLDLENRTVAAYTAGIPLLSDQAKMAATQFLGQELTHTGELAGLVKEAGGKPIKQRASYPLGHPRNETEVLQLLHSLERATVAAYLDAIPRVSPGEVRASLAAVMGNDAQHLSVVRVALGRPPVPSALVGARE
jgi:hypothetical protein